MAPPHFLLVTFPGQGHINPSLQFSKRLIRLGARVTFATAISAHRKMAASGSTDFPEGISFATFSDGHDDGVEPGIDFDLYMGDIQRRGSETLRELIVSSFDRGENFTGVFYTVLIPWVADVAESLRVPATLLWIQPATVFCVYYYYFHGYADAIGRAAEDPSSSIELPGLPVLTGRDIPSFFSPTSPYSFSLPLFRRHFEILDGEEYPKVLLNTFDSLEPEALRAISKLDVRGIGPLLPSAFLDGEDLSDKFFGGDLFHSSKDYIKWLNTKPNGSVIYISFGSLIVLSKPQRWEIAKALRGSSRPFLWVNRDIGKEESYEDFIGCSMEELNKQGIIIPWCSQVEVLSHGSIGCFVTHCGWNSTSEGLVSGVPMVAFPQWTDQHTNAKLIEDQWMTGVRLNTNGESIVVEAKEIMRCLELVLGDGDKGKEIRLNAKKWRKKAIKAVRKGGSSSRNLEAFMDEIENDCASASTPASAINI